MTSVANDAEVKRMRAEWDQLLARKEQLERAEREHAEMVRPSRRWLPERAKA